MAKLSRVVGTTSEVLQLFVQDSSSTVGAGLTGITAAAAGLTAYFARVTNTTTGAISVALTNSVIASGYVAGGWQQISATNMPGFYRLGVPDAAFSGGSSVAIMVWGATNMAPVPLEIELTGTNNQDASGGGMAYLNTTVTSRASVTAMTSLITIVGVAGSGLTTRGAATGISDLKTQVGVAGSGLTVVGFATGIADLKTQIGVAGSGLTAVGDTRMANLDGAITSRATATGITDLKTQIGVAGSGLTTVAFATGVSDLKTQIGVAGSGLTALGDTRVANLDGAITSRATATGITDLKTTIGVAGSGLTVLGFATGVADLKTQIGVAGSGLTTVQSQVLTTQMTESYRADGAAPTLAQAAFELIAHMGEVAIAGTTKSIFKVDGTTTGATFTLDSATSPTTITRAT